METSTQLFVPIQRTAEFALELVDFQPTVSPASQVVLRDCAAAYQVSFTAEGNVAEELQLSVSGLPQGATVEFSANPVRFSDTPIMTIRTSQMAAGVYLMRLVAMPIFP